MERSSSAFFLDWRGEPTTIFMLEARTEGWKECEYIVSEEEDLDAVVQGRGRELGIIKRRCFIHHPHPSSILHIRLSRTLPYPILSPQPISNPVDNLIKPGPATQVEGSDRALLGIIVLKGQRVSWSDRGLVSFGCWRDCGLISPSFLLLDWR